MNKFKQTSWRGLLIMLTLALSITQLNAQTKTINGTVSAKVEGPLVGVAVVVKGTFVGTATDLSGKFSLKANPGDTLQFSYVGFKGQEIAVNNQTEFNVMLESDALLVSEVVVVGYGSQKKSDLTGSIETVGVKDFNQGLISSPEQLLNGKVAGVQITSGSGSPTSGSTIRIRGGASLNASNDPLIVLDGVPLEIGGIAGNDGNFMSMINPADIESMTILKDASSTAIYGSRASNGVVIINTKKGSGDKFRVTASSTNSVQWRGRTVDMLSYNDFIALAKSQGKGDLLGTANTNWNDEIFQAAFGTDNNISVSGRIVDNLPYRASIGYYNQDGILKTDNAERITGNVSLTPSLLDDHLKLNVNLKTAINNNTFAPTGAIWNASTFNPTLPVYSGNNTLGGYYEIIGGEGAPDKNAIKNPLGLIEQTDAQSTVKRIIGNFDVDYKLHFLPELRVHLTAGYDYATGEGYSYVPATAASAYETQGNYSPYGVSEKENKLFTAYLNYNKNISSIKSKIDATAGYDYQYWRVMNPSAITYRGDKVTELGSATNPSDYRHALVSYYGRLNYTFDERYLLTATLRSDGTSRFAEDHRWGIFPSVAAAWRVSQEEFLKNNKTISNLKLRLSYGVTGQQDGIGDYGYMPIYWTGVSNGQYITPDGTYVTPYYPSEYVSDLTWETTKSYNAGFDIGFLNNRLNATVDYYTRKTEDLLATVPSAAGTNFNKLITTNVGNVSSSGFEMSLNYVAINNEDWTWDIGANATWQQVEITNLSLVDNGEVTRSLVGPTIDDKYVQVMTEGQAPYTFYVYKQLYDQSGKPLEGKYADLNADGKITSDDRYYYNSPAPDWMLGFNTSLRWRNMTLQTTLRASIGNYVYNAMAMNTGALETMQYSAPQLNNLSASYLDTGFTTRQFYSDYYVEDASYLKMDNLTFTYDFGRVAKNRIGLRASLMMQNVFTITGYTGIDPEVYNGFDNSFYPRPRIISLGLSLDF